jgi:hypothetical protein
MYKTERYFGRRKSMLIARRCTILRIGIVLRHSPQIAGAQTGSAQGETLALVVNYLPTPLRLHVHRLSHAVVCATSVSTME